MFKQSPFNIIASEQLKATRQKLALSQTDMVISLKKLGLNISQPRLSRCEKAQTTVPAEILIAAKSILDSMKEL